ncbi:transmembrane protein 130 [Megalops cyprinoides]|uniref:transmembrane protein 130 n=1 Tax=Megalops cyprinoides TaxID=118141 RepID=UPI0018642D77|nr:transmembrane protein 130 [Megalops cyprinoides]
MYLCRTRSAVIFVYFCITLVWQGVDTDDTINLSEIVAGKITFRQMEGNETYLRSTGELAADIPTEASFELLDPRHMFRYVKFTYTWDLGNGEVKVGKEPYVRYNYSASGNYTVTLTVGANWARHTKLTGIYSSDLKVLDAIRSIELMGPSDFKVSQSISLSVFVGGSPPMWVCWEMVQNCLSVSSAPCHWVKLYGNIFNLNYTFTATGKYCLNLTVRNDISILQTSYDIKVWRDPTSNLLFIFTCGTLILSTFSLIIVTVCRSNRSAARGKVEVADFSFSPDSPNFEMKSKHVGSVSSVCPSSSSKKKGEFRPLLTYSGMGSSTCIAQV